MRRSILPLLALFALPGAAAAQWQVVPQAGYVSYADGSALGGMAVGGVEVLRDINPLLSAGVSMDFARGKIDGEKFPLAQLDFGVDSTVYAVIHQPVSILSYGARIEFGPRDGALQPYAGLGAGAYTMFLDAQQWDAPTTLSGFQFAVGGGLRFRASDQLTLSIDARDVIYPDFDPNKLNVVREENRNNRFPELNPPPLEAGTMHNIRLTLGLRITRAGGD